MLEYLLSFHAEISTKLDVVEKIIKNMIFLVQHEEFFKYQALLSSKTANPLKQLSR